VNGERSEQKKVRRKISQRKTSTFTGLRKGAREAGEIHEKSGKGEGRSPTKGEFPQGSAAKLKMRPDKIPA